MLALSPFAAPTSTFDAVDPGGLVPVAVPSWSPCVVGSAVGVTDVLWVGRTAVPLGLRLLLVVSSSESSTISSKLAHVMRVLLG